MTAEAEINDLSFDEAVANRELEAREEQDALMLPKLKLEHLWDYREELRRDIARLAESKGRADRELRRRLEESNPAFFDDDAKGSVELTGSALVLSATWTRDYEYHSHVINEELLTLVADNDETPTLTEAEFSDLVKWEPKVSGTEYNRLIKRGGVLAEVLGRMRSLKSARLDFKPKERRA